MVLGNPSPQAWFSSREPGMVEGSRRGRASGRRQGAGTENLGRWGKGAGKVGAGRPGRPRPAAVGRSPKARVWSSGVPLCRAERGARGPWLAWSPLPLCAQWGSVGGGLSPPLLLF